MLELYRARRVPRRRFVEDQDRATLATSFPPNPPATTDTWTHRRDLCGATSASSSVDVHRQHADIFRRLPGLADETLVVIAIGESGQHAGGVRDPWTVQVAASGNDDRSNFPGWLAAPTSRSFSADAHERARRHAALRPIFKLEVAGRDAGSCSSEPARSTTATVAQRLDARVVSCIPTSVATGGTYGVEAHFTTTDPMPVSQWQQLATTLPATDTPTADIAMTLLPAITSTGVSATTSVRPKAVWNAAGPMTHATFGTAAWSWPSGAAHGNWFLIFPPTTTSPVELPALPDALAAYRPPTDGSVSSTPSISFQSDSYDADYDAARQKHATIPTTYEWLDTENPY